MQNCQTVSIVSINYNGAAVTCEMHESLKKISYINIEVIKVDNASKEDPKSIFEKYHWIKFFPSNRYLGLDGANNFGFKEATGKYFMMQNNDTKVPSDFLEPLAERMELKATISCVSPKIIFHHSPSVLQFAGFNPIKKFAVRGTAIGYGMQEDGRFNQSHPFSRAHGAAMMVSRKVVDEFGLMADLYFLYFREMDCCERIKRLGYSIWFESDSTIVQKESISTKKGSTLKSYYLTGNRIPYQKRNMKEITHFISILFLNDCNYTKKNISISN